MTKEMGLVSEDVHLHPVLAEEFGGSDAIDFWHLVNRQDWNICERVQLGMSARVHDRGIFSPMEDWNLDIRKYVSDHIGDYVTEE